MDSIYKELINVADHLEEISIIVERDYDPTVIPKLRTERLIIKYLADRVLQMEDQIIILKRQTMASRRLAFYELLMSRDPVLTGAAKSIAGSYNFDWKLEHRMFTDEEITAVMTVMNEMKEMNDATVE